MIISVGI